MQEPLYYFLSASLIYAVTAHPLPFETSLPRVRLEQKIIHVTKHKEVPNSHTTTTSANKITKVHPLYLSDKASPLYYYRRAKVAQLPHCHYYYF